MNINCMWSYSVIKITVYCDNKYWKTQTETLHFLSYFTTYQCSGETIDKYIVIHACYVWSMGKESVVTVKLVEEFNKWIWVKYIDC